MAWLAGRDPLLDPTVPPAEWVAARRRQRVRRAWLLAVVAVLVGLGAWGGLTFADRTRGLTPEQVAEAAGLALLEARRYDFRAALTGQSPDGFFPSAWLEGEFQAEPRLLHLRGEVGSGAARTPIEYLLWGDALYVRQARGGWVRSPTADVRDVTAFLPDQLAAPLLAGVVRAEWVGREQVGGVPAAVLALELDPAVMQVAPPAQDERIEYRLWVDVWRLRPVRFAIRAERPAGRGSSFAYQLDWTYPRDPGPLTVPDEVRRAAGPTE